MGGKNCVKTNQIHVRLVHHVHHRCVRMSIPDCHKEEDPGHKHCEHERDGYLGTAHTLMLTRCFRSTIADMSTEEMRRGRKISSDDDDDDDGIRYKQG